MTLQSRDDRSTFERLTEAIYWFVVIDVLLVLASAPTVVIWMLLAQDAANLPLYLASAVFVPPAVSAALYAWRKRSEDPDPVPLQVFLRGYQINVLDSVKITVPALAILAVLGTNISFGDSAGTGALTIVFVILAVLVVLLATRATAIVSTFTFRYVDVVRLSIFTLLAMPLRTISLVSLGVLVTGLSLFVGDYVMLFAASLLTFALWSSERPVLTRLRAEFVAGDTAVLPTDQGRDRSRSS